MIGGGRKNDVTDLKDNVFLHRDDDIGYMSDVLTYNSEALKILKKMKKKTDWIQVKYKYGEVQKLYKSYMISYINKIFIILFIFYIYKKIYLYTL